MVFIQKAVLIVLIVYNKISVMITSYELPEILRKQIPELPEAHYTLRPLLQVFAVINDFTDLTGKAISGHQYLLASRCFKLAEKCYHNGDRIIRSLIKHSFVSGFASFMPEDAAEKMFVKSLMPFSLYHLYEEGVSDNDE